MTYFFDYQAAFLTKVAELDIILNFTYSLCHRIYDLPSQSIGLAIYDDRIEIENPGRFPQGLTPENIKSVHKSQPYNQLIAEVLYKTSWLESWGTGVQRMCDVCKEENVPEPYYIAEQGYVTIVFKKGASAMGDGVSDSRRGESDGESDGENQLTDRQRNMLNEISKDGSCTAKSLARLLGTSQRSAERDINFLRKNGFIDKESKDNRSHWVVLKK